MRERLFPVEAIASAAGIHLTVDETELFGRQLGALLDEFDRLSEVDTTGVEEAGPTLPSVAKPADLANVSLFEDD